MANTNQPAYYNTDVMLAAIKSGAPATSFLRDRYFPVLPNGESEFITEDVLIEFENDAKLAAPFVVPYIGGVAMDRDKYSTKRFTPSNIEIKRNLKVEDLMKKGFGEALHKDVTPAQRARTMLAQDLVKLDESVTRREELMAGEVLETNKLVMNAKTNGGPDKEFEIRYYEEVSNPYLFVPQTMWNAAGATIIDDIYAMCETVAENIMPEDLLITPTAFKAFRKDEEILKLLDNRSFDMGEIRATMKKDGAAFLGKINVNGFELNLIMYNQSCKDGNTKKSYLTDGKVIVTAPGVGQTVYGGVTQLEEGDGEYHTYAGRRVPKKITNANNDQSELKVTAKPLLAPRYVGGWVSAVVIGE